MEYSINKILTLENNEKYVVADSVERYQNKYFYVIGVSDDNKELNGVCKIVRITNDNKLVVVDDVNELSGILPLFISHYL